MNVTEKTIEEAKIALEDRLKEMIEEKRLIEQLLSLYSSLQSL